MICSCFVLLSCIYARQNEPIQINFNPRKESVHGSNTPLETLRDGRLKATVWANAGDNNETYHTVTLAKVYEDRNGQLQETSSFSAGELLRVAELAREAHGVIRDLRREQAIERRAEQEAPRAQPAREERPARFRKFSQPGLER